MTDLAIRASLLGALAALLLGGCAATPPPVEPAAPASALPPLPAYQLEYRKEVLPNGLTLVVHEDRKAPIVAVNIWYHVGSKDEPPGKSGFAHLFEHLMFQGSENFRDEYFKPFEEVGATEINGTTWLDRTNYFQNVPTTALDLALWMESDRMGHLLGAIDQSRLDEQRAVVKNEKRQSENRPYGRVWEWLQRASFPEGHPYRWTTIGSMQDLDAASLEDVKGWFGQYYGAANVTLVLAGDVDFDTAKSKVLRYFGDIPAGPPVARRKQWVAARSESTRDRMLDSVAQTRVYRSWNVPAFGSAGIDRLDLAAQILGGSRSSRLDARLIHDEALVDSVAVFSQPFELAGLFVIQADVKAGVDPVRVEAAIEDELRRFASEGPSAEELERAKTTLIAGLVRGAETIGGFGGKSDLLATCEVYTDDPGCVNVAVERTLALTADEVRSETQRWLLQGDHTLVVEPAGDYQTASSEVDRKLGPPSVETFPELSFPRLERARLANGMQVVLAERHDIPVVEFELLFDAGHASDQGIALGTASFTIGMFGEGTRNLSALDLSRREQALGASIGADATLDTTSVSLSALSSRLAESLALYAEVVREPAFRPDDLERLRGQWLASIAQEKSQPAALAQRVLPPLLFGKGHAYAIPLTGSGTEDSIRSLTVDALRDYHQRWFRPDQATLIVVGDTTLEALLPMLEQAFGGWTPAGEPAPAKNIPAVDLPETARVYLLDRPGASQSVVIGGLLAPPASDPAHLDVDTMNAVLGGAFTSRINMNLREDKGWSYGARSLLQSGLAQRPVLIYAPVQTDKTAESLAELRKELGGIVGVDPVRPDELAKIQSRDIRSLPGRYETAAAVAGELRNIVRLGRPDDYVQTLKQRIEAQSLDSVQAAARQVIQPDRVTWVVVGDRARIEAPVRALGLGPVQIIDEDGQPVP